MQLKRGGLETKISSLQNELLQQRSFLAGGRLDVLDSLATRLTAIEARLSAVKNAYDGFRNFSFKVRGRAQHRGGSKPLAVDFAVVAKDFALDACGSAISKSVRPRIEEACRTNTLQKELDLIPSQEYELSALGPSTIASMQYLGEISVAHRDALNRVFTVGDKKEELSLSDFLVSVPQECGIAQNVADGAVDLARILRTIETSAQQLNWVFTYGYGPPAPPLADTAKYLHDQLEGSSAEVLMQSGKLNEANNLQFPKGDERMYSLDGLLQNVAIGYQRLIVDLEEVQAACAKRHKQVNSEKSQIQASLNSLITSKR